MRVEAAVGLLTCVCNCTAVCSRTTVASTIGATSLGQVYPVGGRADETRPEPARCVWEWMR